MISDTTFTSRGDTDPRVAELTELAATEGVNVARIDVILWFEDRGYVVDLETGVAMKVSIERVTPSGIAVNHLLTPATDSEADQLLDTLICKHPDEECVADGTLQAIIDGGDEVPDGTGLAYELGKADYAGGRYLPPFAHDEHVAYIKGQNDAWAAAKNVTWWRGGR